MDFDELYMQAAIEQAKAGLRRGGIPIGAALAVDHVIIGLGHNQRIQLSDPILHAEMDCLRNAGRLSPDIYRRSTIYTTLSPCAMCTGAILLFGIPRVVIGENQNFMGREDLLANNNVKVELMKNTEITEILEEFIKRNSGIWHEDISDSESR